MRNKISLREILLGAILLTATMLLIGCVSKNRCNVDKAYDFASKISKEDPNKLAKARSNTSVIYHDKDLTVKKTLLGNRPTEGKGIFIKVSENGELEVREHDCNQRAKLASGEIKPFEIKGRTFGYVNNENFEGETITLSDNGSIVSYNKNSSGEWDKNCYNASKINFGMDFKSWPTLSKKKVNEKEVLPFLELIEDIRKRYPIN